MRARQTFYHKAIWFLREQLEALLQGKGMVMQICFVAQDMLCLIEHMLLACMLHMSDTCGPAEQSR